MLISSGHCCHGRAGEWVSAALSEGAREREIGIDDEDLDLAGDHHDARRGAVRVSSGGTSRLERGTSIWRSVSSLAASCQELKRNVRLSTDRARVTWRFSDLSIGRCTDSRFAALLMGPQDRCHLHGHALDGQARSTRADWAWRDAVVCRRVSRCRCRAPHLSAN
jgi:hypothetical protein